MSCGSLCVAFISVALCYTGVYGGAGVANIIGDPVSPVPWFVEIYTNGVRSCTGSLIDRRWVLTSGDCIFNISATDQVVCLGEFLQCIAVKKTILHGFYDPGYPTFNIGLVELDSIAKVGSRLIDPVALPTADIDKVIKKKQRRCYIYGKGVDRIEDGRYVETKETSRLSATYIRCKNSAEIFAKSILVNCIRTTPRDQTFCGPSDSGSALVCRHQGNWYLTGLALGYDERDACRAGYIGLVNVASYLQWIDDNMN